MAEKNDDMILVFEDIPHRKNNETWEWQASWDGQWRPENDFCVIAMLDEIQRLKKLIDSYDRADAAINRALNEGIGRYMP